MLIKDGSPETGQQLRLIYDEVRGVLHFAFCEGARISTSIEYNLQGITQLWNLWDQVRPQGFYLLKNHIFAIILAKHIDEKDKGYDYAHFYLVERHGIKMPRELLRSNGSFAHFECYHNESEETIDIESTCFNDIKARVGITKSYFYYGECIEKMRVCDNQAVPVTTYELVLEKAQP